ncbi:MAG: glycosyltransferase [Acidobacteriales bacterium]|nr:glycosyltransferase [Terriglobales bacterium]
MAPIVTIVTPSYNQAQFIRATIESVLSQDYPHIEHIIMDGGSTDGTASIVKEYASRLTWISEKDRGQSHAINKGFRMARGEIVSWLNSDDIILPGAVSKAVAAMQRDPCLGAVYGEGYQIDEAGRVKCRFPWTEPFNLWKLVYVLDYILQQTVYFKKSVVADLGYLDESLHWGMDWDLFVRIGERHPIAYIPELMGAIREYDAAKSFAGGRKRFAEIVRLIRKHGGKRYPPAYFFYGLGTYDKICRDWIDRAFSGRVQPISRLLGHAVSLVCTRGIQHVYRESQGWYSDGWAGRCVHYMIPPLRGGVLEVRGKLPDLGGLLPRQTIRLFAEGRELAQSTFGPGDFRILTDVPGDMQDRVLRLRLEAARHFVPGSSGPAADPRKLCYMLDGIRRQTAPHNIGGSARAVSA